MKRLIQFIFLTILSLFAGVMAQVSTSKWQATPIVIDGDCSDWVTNPRFFNAESNVKYEFRNDAQNLYLIIKSTDNAIQLQLLKAGFIVKLKIKTTPPTKTSITFSALKSEEDQPAKDKKGGKSNKQMDKPANAEAEPYKLMDKSSTEAEIMPKDTAILNGFQYSKGKIGSENKVGNGIVFSRSKSSRELTFYEISVPLRELFGDNYSLETISSTPIQLQVIINGLSQSGNKKMKGSMGGHGGGMGGGMGGGPGGGMGGGPGGGMGGDSNMGELDGGMQGENANSNFSMYKKSFSIDFQLSKNK
jgi:hypothetical protein